VATVAGRADRALVPEVGAPPVDLLELGERGALGQRPVVEPGEQETHALTVLGIARQIRVEAHPRRLDASATHHQRAQQPMGKVRSLACQRGLLGLVERVDLAVEIEIGVPKTDAGLEAAGLDVERDPEVGDRFLMLLASAEREANTVMRLEEAGLQRDRGPIELDALGEPPTLDENVGEVVVEQRLLRLERDGLAVVRDGVGEMALLLEHVGEIVVHLGLVGLHRQRLAIVPHRVRDPAVVQGSVAERTDRLHILPARRCPPLLAIHLRCPFRCRPQPRPPHYTSSHLTGRVRHLIDKVVAPMLPARAW
jgi:hypothetical protein